MAGIAPRKCSNLFCLRPALFGSGKCGKCRSKRKKS